jgi:hypothetical protein
LSRVARELVGLMFEAGPVAYTPNGATAISWQAMKAWVDLCGVVLSPREARLIRWMSQVYATAMNREEEPEWMADDEDIQRAKARQFIASLGGNIERSRTQD